MRWDAWSCPAKSPIADTRYGKTGGCDVFRSAALFGATVRHICSQTLQHWHSKGFIEPECCRPFFLGRGLGPALARTRSLDREADDPIVAGWDDFPCFAIAQTGAERADFVGQRSVVQPNCTPYRWCDEDQRAEVRQGGRVDGSVRPAGDSRRSVRHHPPVQGRANSKRGSKRPPASRSERDIAVPETGPAGGLIVLRDGVVPVDNTCTIPIATSGGFMFASALTTPRNGRNAGAKELDFHGKGSIAW